LFNRRLAFLQNTVPPTTKKWQTLRSYFDTLNTSTEKCIRSYRKLLRSFLYQLCPTRGSRSACRPVKGFVQPSLRFRCSKSILHDNLSLFW